VWAQRNQTGGESFQAPRTPTGKVERMTLITTKQYKFDKSATKGVITAGVQLAPATEAATVLNRPDLPSVCAYAGACAHGCLKFSGMNQYPTHALARSKRTALLHDDPDTFYSQVIGELQAVKRKALRENMEFAIRPNALSDLPKLAQRIAREFPDAHVYDYTKLPKPWLRTKKTPNYTLVYSVSERSTDADIQGAIAHGINCAVVLDVRKGEPLPKTYTLAGITLPLIDGDISDLIYTYPIGVFIGLRWKGSKARLAYAVQAKWARSIIPLALVA
jgi:hypothetical protein